MIQKVFWHVPGRVLAFHKSGRFSLAELRQTGLIINTLADRYGKPPMVHNVQHFIDEDAPEPETQRLQKVLETAAGMKRHPLLGYTIIVSPNQDVIARLISSIAMQSSHFRFRFFNHAQEAFDFLSFIDESLPVPGAFLPADAVVTDLRDQSGTD